MRLTKTRISALTALVIAGVWVSVVLQRQSQVRLEAENELLRRQVAELEGANQDLAHQLRQADARPTLSETQLRDLLKLRGEVNLLRNQLKEAEQSNSQKDRQRTASAGGDNSTTHPPDSQAPFQIRLVVDEQAANAETIIDKSKAPNANTAESLYVEKTPLMDSAAIQSVKVSADRSGAPQLEIVLTDQGRELFANITKENVNKRLAIMMDGESYLAPIIRNEITGGKIQLTGTFTDDQARELAAKINEAAGAHY